MSGFRNLAFRFWFQRVSTGTLTLSFLRSMFWCYMRTKSGAAWGISLLNHMMMVLLSVMAAAAGFGNLLQETWVGDSETAMIYRNRSRALLWIQWSAGRMKQFHESSPILKTSHLFLLSWHFVTCFTDICDIRVELISKIGACFCHILEAPLTCTS